MDSTAKEFWRDFTVGLVTIIITVGLVALLGYLNLHFFAGTFGPFDSLFVPDEFGRSANVLVDPIARLAFAGISAALTLFAICLVSLAAIGLTGLLGHGILSLVRPQSVSASDSENAPPQTDTEQ